jgi:hypothetical protein
MPSSKAKRSSPQLIEPAVPELSELELAAEMLRQADAAAAIAAAAHDLAPRVERTEGFRRGARLFAVDRDNEEPLWHAEGWRLSQVEDGIEAARSGAAAAVGLLEAAAKHDPAAQLAQAATSLCEALKQLRQARTELDLRDDVVHALSGDPAATIGNVGWLVRGEVDKVFADTLLGVRVLLNAAATLATGRVHLRPELDD